MDEDFYLRILNPEDGSTFRAIRLHALKTDGRYFGSSYEKELQYDDKEWARICTETQDHCVIGLFKKAREEVAGSTTKDELVGVTTVTRWGEDVSGETVLLGSSFIERDYRNAHLGSRMYLERMKWIENRPKLKHAILFIRDGNGASTKLHQKFGAEHIYDKPMLWADGQQAIAHWYKIELHVNHLTPQ